MIVVTGAAGFIGSQLAGELLLRGVNDLLLVDHPIRLKKAHHENSDAPFMTHIEFVAEFESGKMKPEIIFHMGACSDTTEPRWDYLRQNNLDYTKRLWSCGARDGSRLIYASSASTYGDGAKGFDDESDLSQLKPLNLYGRSKHEFDLWALEQIRTRQPAPPQWVGFKFFNVFGPGEAHKGRMASMVYHGFNQIEAEGKMRLFKSHRYDYTDGGQLRDFIYVKDVVDVMLKVAANRSVNGIFNLGTAQARSFADLGRSIFTALGRKPRIDYIPIPDDLQGKYQYFTEAKMHKLAKAGIQHQFQNLEDSVRDYVQNHLRAGEQ